MKFVAVLLFSASLALAGCSHPQAGYYPPPPPSASQVFQQGFHDGFDAAKSDVRHNRPPVFDRHPRFRNPPVPPPAWAEYRQAFHEGYDRFLHQGPGPGY